MHFEGLRTVEDLMSEKHLTGNVTVSRGKNCFAEPRFFDNFLNFINTYTMNVYSEPDISPKKPNQDHDAPRKAKAQGAIEFLRWKGFITGN